MSINQLKLLKGFLMSLREFEANFDDVVKLKYCKALNIVDNELIFLLNESNKELSNVPASEVHKKQD